MKDKEVTAFIKKKPSPQREVANFLRRVIHKTYPKINEEMRYGAPWYEDKYYLGIFSNSVNLGLSINGMTKANVAKLQGNGKLMRHVKFKTPDDLDEKQIVRYLKMVKKGCDMSSHVYKKKKK